ncbi:EAL domain-containing protein [Zhihengliuella flava]|uniref:EAL domain-containing protein (Putative c-di-GMP-specific phosphodiesterase class I) n=1 Tax=Zhihengliuella flava TaxID=1285193 RepID=A0A931D5D8_9MICC|nr:EAL domain-containing protein (putative c-di-GMP-specific phosphodiesterase class I) [Zhihengliuella flava]
MTRHFDGAQATIPATIVFQPIMNLRLNRVVGYEALARFADGRSPLAWLGEARAEGRLTDLELSLIARTVDVSPLVPDGMFLTVNASGATMRRMAHDGIDLPDRLHWGIELSEASADDETYRSREYADHLGCLLLIDDAGTGCSTVERVRSLRPEYVKLDRSLIAGQVPSSPCAAEIEAFIAEAAAVGAQTVAEGIETEDEEEFVRSAGITLAQGFRYGRPATPWR